MKDNFSKQAHTYAKFRPHYPAPLYQHLLSRVKNPHSAWDCGTGNGQVAVELAQYFSQVYATDISQAQLDQAPLKENIEYTVASAEKSGLADRSIDLITVAQAAHWFDQDKFSKEIKRVAKPGCVVAYWLYHLPIISPDIDKAVMHFHDQVIGDYWDPEREIWRSKYAGIHLDLDQMVEDRFEYQTQWDFEQLAGYLNSWSAVQHYIKRNGTSPVSNYLAPLKPDWNTPKNVTFPIFLFAGIVST
ncbi:class I SAM-dependent methyltransferase [Fulvivirga sp. M361]|uniref:class I SAM-dependent methyltransferase n=1 Tax=Fulvivirga sp. M361 TaxID=2594266 RepID=UPI001179C9EF|nr:class I SAM-dependent methyltransferase [Fulvivirga sp. M361]TRX62097.1 class I SAM-dependent methyltransferase [Fulvivirga sp. M361]